MISTENENINDTDLNLKYLLFLMYKYKYVFITVLVFNFLTLYLYNNVSKKNFQINVNLISSPLNHLDSFDTISLQHLTKMKIDEVYFTSILSKNMMLYSNYMKALNDYTGEIDKKKIENYYFSLGSNIDTVGIDKTININLSLLTNENTKEVKEFLLYYIDYVGVRTIQSVNDKIQADILNLQKEIENEIIGITRKNKTRIRDLNDKHQRWKLEVNQMYNSKLASLELNFKIANELNLIDGVKDFNFNKDYLFGTKVLKEQIKAHKNNKFINELVIAEYKLDLAELTNKEIIDDKIYNATARLQTNIEELRFLIKIIDSLMSENIFLSTNVVAEKIEIKSLDLQNRQKIIITIFISFFLSFSFVIFKIIDFSEYK